MDSRGNGGGGGRRHRPSLSPHSLTMDGWQGGLPVMSIFDFRDIEAPRYVGSIEFHGSFMPSQDGKWLICSTRLTQMKKNIAGKISKSFDSWLHCVSRIP